MSFTPARAGRMRAEINITPLVDVVLVLLIIFMVTTPILLKQLDVTVPTRADTRLAAPPPTEAQVILQVGADGQLALDGAPLPAERLAESIRAAFAERPGRPLFFDIDDRANYGWVVQVMDVCRGAGVKTLGITTK